MKEAILKVNDFLDGVVERLNDRLADEYGEYYVHVLWADYGRPITGCFTLSLLANWLMYLLLWRKFVRKVKGLFSKR